MPEWNTIELLPLKQIILHYINSFNNRDFDQLGDLFTPEISIIRGDTVSGKERVVNLFKQLFGHEHFNDIKFEVVDATAGVYNENEAQIILYCEIYNGDQKLETFVETLALKMIGDYWKIDKIFGLSLDMESHRAYFEPFIKKSE